MQTHLTLDCVFRFPSGFALELQYSTASRIIALTGPSGAGKTTVLHLIAGLLRPEQGRITHANEVWTDTTSNIFVPPQRRRVGYLFQDYRLFPHLRVANNLRYGHTDKQLSHVSFDEIVEELELQQLLKRFPQELSGGQRQRVALGRALLTNPAVLLLDEPLTNVEIALREKISLFINRIVTSSEITVLIVSHERELLDRFAQETITIYDLQSGKLQARN